MEKGCKNSTKPPDAIPKSTAKGFETVSPTGPKAGRCLWCGRTQHQAQDSEQRGSYSQVRN